mgnify:CR=1 FL=1
MSRGLGDVYKSQVCECCHNVSGCKCDLPQIKVTEQCTCDTQQVETPHYCQSYEKK